MKRYLIQMVIETDSNQRKWISEAISLNLHHDEDIVEYDITENTCAPMLTKFTMFPEARPTYRAMNPVGAFPRASL